MLGLNSALQPSPAAQKRILVIGPGDDVSWASLVRGAQAAAKQFGVDVRCEVPRNCKDQAPSIEVLDTFSYDGVGLCSNALRWQLAEINELADRTKLVTIGTERAASQRLCNLRIDQTGKGRKVAFAVRESLPSGCKVALLHAAGELPMELADRLDGFCDVWSDGSESAPPTGGEAVRVPIQIATPIRAAERVVSILKDARFSAVVACDADSSDVLACVLHHTPSASDKLIVAMDVTANVLDLIGDGKIRFAIYDDPYRLGYESIERLAVYCSGDESALPVAGHGCVPLLGEIVRRDNLPEIRRRLGPLPASARYAASCASSVDESNEPTFELLHMLGNIFQLPFAAAAWE